MNPLVDALAAEAVARGATVVLINASSSQTSEHQALLQVGLVSLEEACALGDVVVHHGGVGTMDAVLRAARPAVVVPQAFDQGFNGRALERAEMASVVADGDPSSVIERGSQLARSARQARLEAFATGLLPPVEAARRAWDECAPC